MALCIIGTSHTELAEGRKQTILMFDCFIFDQFMGILYLRCRYYKLLQVLVGNKLKFCFMSK